ncbi:DUF4148 domain-containing protein [Xenophilus arseniciresistens]|uniref:DUF4148 domain-containing protein n=1 Tax=Xenophilus arseniciresistens TaxID=1283306 RepID=A0AAE3N5S9_9BURK|nr:DUF4148 domain-containing protein [Xenophilus arseniciresistens]MDA7414896.1 DUF4148 domain-containing protein [Xenophilus arseniciresistens]
MHPSASPRLSRLLASLALAAAVAPAMAAGGAPAGSGGTATPLTRAQVHAEAVAWTQSGLGQMAYGEIGADSRGPSYERALQAFRALNEGRQAMAAPPAAAAPRAP